MLSIVCQGLASHAYRYLRDLRTLRAAHVAFVPVKKIIQGFNFQGGVFTWYVAFRIQMNAYLFIDRDMEDSVTVVKWRSGDK